MPLVFVPVIISVIPPAYGGTLGPIRTLDDGGPNGLGRFGAFGALGQDDGGDDGGDITRGTLGEGRVHGSRGSLRGTHRAREDVSR